MSALTFESIQQIRDHRFIGSAYSDQSAFDAICEFADLEDRSIAERAEALRIMARKGMGLSGEDAGDELSDFELLVEYELSKAEVEA